MKEETSVSLAPFSHAGDISITKNIYQNPGLDAETVSSINSIMVKHFQKYEAMFHGSVKRNNATEISEFLEVLPENFPMKERGCEAAILIGDIRLMERSIAELTFPMNIFWEARANLLSGKQEDAIVKLFENMEAFSKNDILINATRNIANGLGDIGLYKESVMLCDALQKSYHVRYNDDIMIKVLIDSFRAYCRFGKNIDQIVKEISRLTFRNSNQWPEQIFFIELMKWDLVSEIEKRNQKPSEFLGKPFDWSDLIARMKSINRSIGNRLSEILFKIINALKFILNNNLMDGQIILEEVISEASRKPYCNFLVFEAARLAQCYLGANNSISKNNSYIIQNYKNKNEYIAGYLAQKGCLARLSDMIGSENGGVSEF